MEPFGGRTFLVTSTSGVVHSLSLDLPAHHLAGSLGAQKTFSYDLCLLPPQASQDNRDHRRGRESNHSL